MNKKCKECVFLKKAIQENQEKYQELVENINEVIFQIDKAGQIMYISPVIFNLTGYRPEEIIGKNFKEFILKKDLQGLITSWKNFWSGTSEPYEFRIITKEGFPLYVKTFSKILKKSDKKESLIGVLTDISWRKKTEITLRESQEKLKMILEDLPMFIYRFRPNGEITYANKNYCDYFQLEIHYLLGKNIFSLLDKKDRQAMKKRLATLTLQNPSVQYEANCLINKRIRHQGWTDRAIFNSKGKIVAFQCIGRDITEKKEAQERLIASYQYLGSINRRVSVLLELNELNNKKRKKETIQKILWSALEISSAELAGLYLPNLDKKRKFFKLANLVTKDKLNQKDKLKIERIAFNCPLAKKLKIGQLNPNNQMVNFSFGNLKNKNQIKNFLALPFLKKNKYQGFFLLGFNKNRKLDDQEIGFLKVFSAYAFSLLSESGKID